MTWYKELYISEAMRDTWQEKRAHMDSGDFDRGTWVVCIPVNARDQLDIRRASELGCHGLAERIPMVVGLAESRKAAVGLVERIARDWAAAGCAGTLRSFLQGAR